MNVFITLTEIVCCNCSTHFAMDASLDQRLLETGGIFYCPNGHGQSYSDTEVAKLKRQNQALRNSARYAEEEALRAKKEKTALKGQLTKTRNRIANGVCPCCHRTFKQVEQHMANKHPDFKAVV